MKKILILFLAIALCVGALASCAPEDSGNVGDNGGTQTPPATDNTVLWSEALSPTIIVSDQDGFNFENQLATHIFDVTGNIPEVRPSIGEGVVREISLGDTGSALSVKAYNRLDDLFNQISEGVKTLNIIVKADVKGSAEAVKASLAKLSNEEVRVSVIHAGVGGINEGDVMLAYASNAIIIGFGVRPDKNAIDSAERQKVEIRTYRIIYECLEEIEEQHKYGNRKRMKMRQDEYEDYPRYR